MNTSQRLLTGLEPAARRLAARDLSHRIDARYPGQVLLGGVYGSAATKTATPWSDLELFFVVKNGCDARGQHLVFRKTALGYRVYQQGDLEQILRYPAARWPFHMGVLAALEVLTGDPALRDYWLKMGQAVPEARYREALKALLPDLVLEAHTRLHSCQQRGASYDMVPAVLEMLFEMRTALCLLNRNWVTHDYFQGLTDSFRFTKLPADYDVLVPALYSAREPGEIITLADQLAENFWTLMDREGLTPQSYEEVAEIPV
jgi:hypothetical protein